MNAPIADFGILLTHASRDRIHLGLSLLRRHSWPEFPEDGDHMVQTEFLAGIDGQRRIEIAAADQLQTGRGDANDSRGHAIERNRFADESRVRCKTTLPQTFADDDDCSATGFLFVRPELAAGEEPRAENLGQNRADGVSSKLLRFPISTQSEGGVSDCGELFERLRLLAPGEKVQHGGREGGQVESCRSSPPPA